MFDLLIAKIINKPLIQIKKNVGLKINTFAFRLLFLKFKFFFNKVVRIKNDYL